MSLESDGGMIYWQGKNEELWEKPLPVPLYPPQIPHGLTRERTRASMVRGRRLTTWAMARPVLYVIYSKFANDTFIMRVSTALSKGKRYGRNCSYSTTTLETLLVTVFSLLWTVFPSSNRYSSRRRIILCNCQDLECRHLYRRPQTTLIPFLQVPISNRLPQ
jgi:hypothetical protein